MNLHPQHKKQLPIIMINSSGTSPRSSPGPDDMPTMIELAHRIQGNDDIDSISDCSSYDEDNDPMDLQPIPMDSTDWNKSSRQSAAIANVVKPVFSRQSSATSRSMVPTIISFEADEFMEGVVHQNKDMSFAFPEQAVVNCLPRLVDKEMDMDDRSIATFSVEGDAEDRKCGAVVVGGGGGDSKPTGQQHNRIVSTRPTITHMTTSAANC